MLGGTAQAGAAGRNGRVSPVVVPALLGLALLTASAVPAAQTLLPKVKAARPVPVVKSAAEATKTRIPLAEESEAVPARAAVSRSARGARVSASTTHLVSASRSAAAPLVAVKLDSVDTLAMTPTVTVVTDLTSARSSSVRLSGTANAVPEPGTLALVAVAAFPALAVLRRRRALLA